MTVWETQEDPKKYYRVMRGLTPGDEPPPYKARMNKAGSKKWTSVSSLPWRQTEEEAEADLREFAAKHNLKVSGVTK